MRQRSRRRILLHGEGEGKFVKLDLTRNIDPTSVHVLAMISLVTKIIPKKDTLTGFKIKFGLAK